MDRQLQDALDPGLELAGRGADPLEVVRRLPASDCGSEGTSKAIETVSVAARRCSLRVD